MTTMPEIWGTGAGSPFWQFSLRIYRSQEVQNACLALQDGSGVDVNILLFMLWLGSQGRELSAAEARRVIDAVEPWRAGVVVPLRTARRELKEPAKAIEANGAELLRLQVKRMELEAERLQQEALYALAKDGGLGRVGVGASMAAAANVDAYGAALGRALPAEHAGVMLRASAGAVP